MANGKILCALLLLCLFALTECGKWGGGGRSSSRGSSSSSRGSSSWGKGWGGSSSSSSSSGSSYKPSYSWSSGSSSSSSRHNPSYPSSSSGLSGFGSSWSKPSYPTSSSGLSGFGSSSSSGSSWSYPSSSSGLSGSNSWNKPSSSWSTGSSSNSHRYPTSGSGLSGSGNRYPSSGSGSHSYPSSNGLSGSGSKPHYNINTGRYEVINTHHYIPHSYYSAPQHVYVSQYRNSDSRYGDLLTGLTLYNMGRSHSHYHDHYYYDDYYRHRYNDNYYGSYNNGNNYQAPQSSYERPSDKATCSLRINNDGKLDVLKIPCEIVSTFTEGGRKVQNETHVNTVCKYNITVIPHHADTSTKLPPIDESDVTTVSQNTTAKSTASSNVITFTNKTENGFIQNTTTVTVQETTVNITSCNITYTDPLSVKGGPITAFDKMECSVDINTREAHIRNPVDCKTLMEYSKMPVPKKENKPLLPPREKLKSWMDNPPWWLAMFIAV